MHPICKNCWLISKSKLDVTFYGGYREWNDEVGGDWFGSYYNHQYGTAMYKYTCVNVQ